MDKMNKKIKKEELLRELKSLKTQVSQLKSIRTGKKRAQEVLHESMELYHTLVEISPEAIALLDLTGRIIMVNDQALALYGIKDIEFLLDKDVFEIIRPKDRARAMGNLQKTLQDSLRNIEYQIVNYQGEFLSVEINSTVIKNKKGLPIAFMIVLRNITQCKLVEKELRYKNQLKTIITELSSKFINLSDVNFNIRINEALSRLGEFAAVDRCYIFLFSEDKKNMDNSHEWCAVGIDPQIFRLRQLPIKKFPWVVKKIKAMDIVHVDSVVNLTEKASAEKKEWQAEGIHSLINVPMVCQGKVIGFLGFDLVRQEKTWSDDLQELLRVVSDMFANTIRRRQMDRNIKSLNKELLQMNMRLK